MKKKKNKVFIDKAGNKVHEIVDAEQEMGEIYNTAHIRETPEINSWRYSILHEIGHLICSYSCCREHAEFEAHGAAKAMCFILGIDIGSAEDDMTNYAGWSSHKACGRIELQKL